MIPLGHLSFFQKRGLFYDALEVFSTGQFAELEKTALLKPTTQLERFEQSTKHELIPVDEFGTMDYVTATFEDIGQANYPYDITVWLLVEELPIELQTNHKH